MDEFKTKIGKVTLKTNVVQLKPKYDVELVNHLKDVIRDIENGYLVYGAYAFGSKDGTLTFGYATEEGLSYPQTVSAISVLKHRLISRVIGDN